MIDSDESSQLVGEKALLITTKHDQDQVVKWPLRNVEPGALHEILGPQETRPRFLAGRGRAQRQRRVLIESVRRVEARVGRLFEEGGRVTVAHGRRERRVLPPRALFAIENSLAV